MARKGERHTQRRAVRRQSDAKPDRKPFAEHLKLFELKRLEVAKETA